MEAPFLIVVIASLEVIELDDSTVCVRPVCCIKTSAMVLVTYGAITVNGPFLLCSTITAIHTDDRTVSVAVPVSI